MNLYLIEDHDFDTYVIAENLNEAIEKWNKTAQHCKYRSVPIEPTSVSLVCLKEQLIIN